jgi:hypothetical protein
LQVSRSNALRVSNRFFQIQRKLAYWPSFYSETPSTGTETCGPVFMVVLSLLIILSLPPSLGIPDKSENIFQIYLEYILGYILDTSQIYLGYRCIPDISSIYPRCIPDISQIHPTSRIYLEYNPDLSRVTNKSGIHLFIPHISGIPRLVGTSPHITWTFALLDTESQAQSPCSVGLLGYYSGLEESSSGQRLDK